MEEDFFICQDYCMEMLEKLIEESLRGLDNNDFIAFLCTCFLILAYSCFNGSFYPEGLMQEFEKERIHLSSFRSLTRMTPELSKMLIGVIILVRILILRVFISIESEFESDYTAHSHQYSYNNKSNMIILSSIIYHSFNAYITSTINPTGLGSDPNLKSGSSLSLSPTAPRASRRDDALLSGVIPLSKFPSFFVTSEDSMQLMSAYLDKIVDNYYQFAKHENDKYWSLRRGAKKRKE